MNSKSPILFLDLAITGHHVEYLYHLISYRITHPEKPLFLLVTHPDFINRLSDFDFPENLDSKGIIIIHPSQEVMRKLSRIRTVFKQAKEEFRILVKIVHEYQIQRCYLMTLNIFQFTIGCHMARELPCGIRGILFNPFGIAGNRVPTWLTKLRKHFQALWMLRNTKLEHIYILNDKKMVNSLNLRYDRQNFFVSLPDPILTLPKKHLYNGDSLPIKPSEKTRFLVFGSLSARKGIFLILEALARLPDDFLVRTEVVFAGRVRSQDQEAFDKAFFELKRLRPTLSIDHINEFIPYESIPKLFQTVDCVLVPYVGNQASSGVLGHTALYKRPVIGQSQGLVGRLIRQYKFGLGIEHMDAANLAAAVTKFIQNGTEGFDSSGMERFVAEHHPNCFVETLLK